MNLLTKSWIEANQTDLEEWKISAYKDFSSMMLNTENPYPCVPGIQGFQKDQLRFGFTGNPQDDTSHIEFASMLKTYGKISRDTGNYASIVVFFDSRNLTFETDANTQYQELFWSILNRVHELDEAPWPEDIPQDPHDAAWEFCFDGEPYFAFCATPSHIERKSRYFPYFLLALQPRWVFDEINASTTFGQKLKKVIRRRLKDYDGKEAHPNLKWYGQNDNHEWKQYYLSDDGQTPSKCPFTAMKNRLKKIRI
ncbi:YqcI/YcgG family protein [Bacillus sp. SCS-153A]|uniref:YqcI/YcgG family protein n=1 Tax=Rossellomorea sedimentorum TaxID=3115294 RepID=UPI00390640AD